MVKPTSSLLSSILLILCPTTAFMEATQFLFTGISGFLCINSNFTVTVKGAVSDTFCGLQCSDKPNCQAFTMTDGPCQLFVFDKCSKYVRDCNCTRRGQVFVKQQPGLQPGALCLSGYGDDLCGVKYKLRNSTGTWQQQQAFCQSESGSMVIMSDVIDATEMNHLDSLYTKYSSEFWLGGFQAPGSPEPAGGWSWVSCNITLDGSLWGSGEPDNFGGTQNAITRYSGHTKLSDAADFAVRRVMCECLSPFD